MTSSKYQDYILEISALLKNHILKSKKNCNKTQSDQKEFYDGYCFGMQRLMAVMLLQASFSLIDLKSIGLDDIDPDYNLYEI